MLAGRTLNSTTLLLAIEFEVVGSRIVPALKKSGCLRLWMRQDLLPQFWMVIRLSWRNALTRMGRPG